MSDNSIKYLNTPYYKECVLEQIPMIPCGIHHSEIAMNTKLRKAQVRAIIRILRREGYPICSNPIDGYWMARNSREIQEMIDFFNSYIESMQQTVEALNSKKLEKLEEEINSQ